MALGFDEVGVLAVERVRLPARPDAEDVGVAFQQMTHGPVGPGAIGLATVLHDLQNRAQGVGDATGTPDPLLGRQGF